MQPVLLVNPTGGHKHAYHPAELESDLAHGWAVVEAKQDEGSQDEPPKRKPGRPRKDEK